MSGKKAWNSTFSTENGDIIYETWSPKRIFGRTTTINRVEDWNGHVSSSHLAQFAWKTFCSARLHFRNQEVQTRSFFRKKGWGIHGWYVLLFVLVSIHTNDLLLRQILATVSLKLTDINSDGSLARERYVNTLQGGQ